MLPSNQQSRDGGTSSADPRHPGTFYKIIISSHYRDCITIFLLTCEIMKYTSRGLHIYYFSTSRLVPSKVMENFSSSLKAGGPRIKKTPVSTVSSRSVSGSISLWPSRRIRILPSTSKNIEKIFISIVLRVF